MNLLKILLYGLVSGISEILPVSLGGHQAVFRKMFGDSVHFDIYNIFVHIGILLSLTYSCRPMLNRIRVAGSRNNKAGASADRRVIKDARLALIIVTIVSTFLSSNNFSLLWVSLFFILNGIILLIPSLVATANKDARSMSLMDSMLIGFLGGLSVFPGLSRVGTMSTVISLRGGDRNHGVFWTIALCIPAMVILIISDIYIAITQGISFYFSQILHYLLAFAGAFCGAYVATGALQRLAKRIGFSFLSYYSWGLAILTFILYLMV